MLDGLLGRGFSVKCKSLIKMTRSRIELVRRRAEAKQRFLREDLAKLLSNGLDINAYGRTEEFLAGMNLLFCYDFVEQTCEYIVKLLSRMQKQGDCPEECREAVASLMFAAARFSDLPELRELRDIFQKRYGNCLEAFVNQKFVEKLSSKSSSPEERRQVLQDIASEFSIKWDSRWFQRRMATPSIIAPVDAQKPDILKQKPGYLQEKKRIHSHGQGNIWRRDEKLDHHIARRNGKTEYLDESGLKGGNCSLHDDGISYPIVKTDTELNVGRSNSSSQGKMLDNNIHNINTGFMRPSNGSIHNPCKGASREAFTPSSAENQAKTENVISAHSYSNQDSALKLERMRSEEGSDRLKPCSSYALAPPYVKSKDNNHNISPPPYLEPTEDKNKQIRGSKLNGSDLDENFIEPSANKSNISSSADRYCEEQFSAPSKELFNGNGKEQDYQDEKIHIPLHKPRSIRKKHRKSSASSSYNNAIDAVEDDDSVARGSSSRGRRKDYSKRGLQILFDEELHHRKDEEERMIDKLLIHYSKKPTSFDVGKLRKKLPGPKITDGGEVSLDQNRDEFPPPSRSVSLPHKQTASPEKKKVFARASSFQPDNQARHVHPKLPDYDDLAARFAALKGR